MNRITKWLSLAVLVVLVMGMAPAVSPAEACCCCGGPGVGTPGYWKNHPEAWPVEEITIGGLTYTKDEAIAWLGAPVKRDKTITLFKAEVATLLNWLIGNDASCLGGTWWAADGWLTSHPVGSGVPGNSPAWRCAERLYLKLDAYNNGLLCAPSR